MSDDLTPPTTPPPPPGYGMPAAPPPGPAIPYAAWGQRALAALIDAGVLLGAYVAFFILRAIMPGFIDVLLSLVLFAAVIGWLVYNWGIQQGTTGYTLGKGIVGIKLVAADTGQPVGTGLGIARQFVHAIDSIPCYIGYLWPLWDEKKQTFTDKVLNHHVIVAPKA